MLFRPACFFLSLMALLVINSTGMAQTKTKTDPTKPTEQLPLFDPAIFGFNKTPIEVGSVKWTRDWAAAKKLSAETDRPLFVLFQEVPG